MCLMPVSRGLEASRHLVHFEIRLKSDAVAPLSPFQLQGPCHMLLMKGFSGIHTLGEFASVSVGGLLVCETPWICVVRMAWHTMPQ